MCWLQTSPADLIFVCNVSVYFLWHITILYTLNCVSIVETFYSCLSIRFHILKRLFEGLDYEIRHAVCQVVIVIVGLKRKLASHVAVPTFLILIVSRNSVEVTL